MRRLGHLGSLTSTKFLDSISPVQPGIQPMLMLLHLIGNVVVTQRFVSD
jgi:hypothetical protein